MSTPLITSISELRTLLREGRMRGRSVGLVPTMGGLHKGHESLIRRAKQQCDSVVVSIFVNPTQFGSSQDFATYPRDLAKDTQILSGFNVAAIFAPREEEVYPAGFETFVEPSKLGTALEGASRPGHFRGVATIVLKLLNIIQPDVAYFGQKDFQQVQVIRHMVEDLNLGVRLVIGPIVRESDGLALSSRNVLLSPAARQAATVLSRCLRHGESLVQAGEVHSEPLLKSMKEIVEKEPLVSLDYLALVDPQRFEPVEQVAAGTVALIAARVDSVRLIDNLILGPPGSSPDLLLQLAFAARPIIDSGARIPGLEIEALSRRIAGCRDCAAVSSVLIPPREFMVKYLKRDNPNLNSVRVLVIGRDAPMNPENYLYRQPELPSNFVKAIYDLLGVRSFDEFRQTCVLTDAVRCHVQAETVSDRALTYCARHLREELKQFPNLQTVVILGKDAYRQFQRDILERSRDQIRPFEEVLTPQGWAQEEVSVPFLSPGTLRVVYSCHPTMGHMRQQWLRSGPPPCLRDRDSQPNEDPSSRNLIDLNPRPPGEVPLPDADETPRTPEPGEAGPPSGG